MAQNVWINASADKSSGTVQDSLHHHTIAGGTAASGDFTVSFDSAVVTSLAIFDSLMKQVRQRVIGGGLK